VARWPPDPALHAFEVRVDARLFGCYDTAAEAARVVVALRRWGFRARLVLPPLEPDEPEPETTS
jgi:hypothetical protein